jgi:hypothetical protein
MQSRSIEVPSLLTFKEPGGPEELASCAVVTQQVQAHILTVASPTLLGTSTLEAGKRKKMESEELQKFLKQHKLEHLKNTIVIRWRAKNL